MRPIGKPNGLLHHSNEGSQRASEKFPAAQKTYCIRSKASADASDYVKRLNTRSGGNSTIGDIETIEFVRLSSVGNPTDTALAGSGLKKHIGQLVKPVTSSGSFNIYKKITCGKPSDRLQPRTS